MARQFFEEARCQSELLPQVEAHAMLERIAKAQALLGPDGALDRLRAWKTPEEHMGMED